MNETVAISPRENQNAVADFEKALANHFGRSFSVERLGRLGAATDRLSELVDELHDSTSAKSVVSNGDGSHTFALAWSDQRESWIAVAECAPEEGRLLSLLAESWERERAREREEEELSLLSRQLTMQVSRGFEELTLSRLLATALSSCDASQDMSHLASMILPDLRRTIRAGTVALIGRDSGPVPQIEGIERADEAQPSDELILDCMGCFASVAQFQPFVCNEAVVAAETNITDIRGLAIVAVHKGDQIAGWLVALNPVDRNICSQESDVQKDQEFGSFESGLMETAASFLSSQARNSSLVRELEGLLTSIIKVLVSTIEAKDLYTRGHSERVAEYALMIAEEMGFTEEEAHRIHFTGLLHDIGKIGIPDAVLQKTGQLTDEEFEVIKQHPEVGWSILKDIPSLAFARSGVLFHHERFDGRGYPAGLSGTDIPMLGRVLAVADAFDAMTSDRSYRRSMSFERVQSILSDGAGLQWDPQVVDAATRVMPRMVAVAKTAIHRQLQEA